jgi:hypothetical protein
MTSFDVGKWMMNNGLAKYADNCEYACLDGRALLLLRDWSERDVKGYANLR